jgi:hypothetical protein
MSSEHLLRCAVDYRISPSVRGTFEYVAMHPLITSSGSLSLDLVEELSDGEPEPDEEKRTCGLRHKGTLKPEHKKQKK